MSSLLVLRERVLNYHAQAFSILKGGFVENTVFSGAAGDYILGKLAFKTAMFNIYEAEYVDNGKKDSGKIAIKVIAKTYENETEFLEMFDDEVTTLMLLNHKNIHNYIDSGVYNSKPFLVTEWDDGVNLANVLSLPSSIGITLRCLLACKIGEQVALALDYLYNAPNPKTGGPFHIIHRSIKPSSIRLSRNFDIKLIDFSIHKSPEIELSTRPGVIKGTMSYLSPEQVNAQKLDGRSDQFALGTVLWEFLTEGQKLFPGKDYAEIMRKIANSKEYVNPPSTVINLIPPEIDSVVMKCLGHYPEDRFETAAEFAKELTNLVERFGSTLDCSLIFQAMLDGQ